MIEDEYLEHFRTVPEKFARRCQLLVAAQPSEHVVGYWGGYNATLQSPNILTFDAQLLIRPGTDPVSKWICLAGSRRDVTPHETASVPAIEQGYALTSIDAKSYPHPDEDWEAYAPKGYADWLTNSPPTSRGPVMDALRAYDRFYRANYPYSATERETFAVVGGWGLYIFGNEWAGSPVAENVVFTLADSEPYFSVRRLPSGELKCKAIIT